ncbi:DUF6364 family protein [Dyadobacter sp. MSC1_007]|jgi:hypothetical protein|uniref:DUF6364 family protein n=1 Tax=Dyadobacter sp. MSC1_007 TaxID=2909264 RepID=UPI0020303104|nr:DUF6364 family protein [Dyadobacter sp. MSC1_007]
MKAAKDPKIKLTLSVRKSAIESARKFAGKRHISLSFLVEEYLDQFHETKSDGVRKAGIINSLFGCLKDSPMRNMTDREIKDMMIKDKYGI